MRVFNHLRHQAPALGDEPTPRDRPLVFVYSLTNLKKEKEKKEKAKRNAKKNASLRYIYTYAVARTPHVHRVPYEQTVSPPTFDPYVYNTVR